MITRPRPIQWDIEVDSPDSIPLLATSCSGVDDYLIRISIITNHFDKGVEFQIMAESGKAHSGAKVTKVPGTNEIVHTPPIIP